MTNHYVAFRLLPIIMMLFSAQWLPAQWESVPTPGDESIFGLYNIAGVWVAHGETGCYQSTNDGLSWIKTLDFTTSYAAATTQHGNDLFAISFGQGLYKSSSQGMKWDLLSNELPAGLVYPKRLELSDNYILFASYSAVYRYDKTTPAAPEPVLDFGQLYYPNSMDMQINGNDVWVAVKDSLLRSTDEGTTWNLVYEGLRARDFAIHGDTIILCTDAGLQRSVNNGVTWSLVLSVNSPYGIFWHSGQWYCRANGYLITSSDGGGNWHSYSTLLDEVGVTISTIGENGGTTLLGSSVGILRSADGGNYWEVRNSGIQTDPFLSSNEGRVYNLGNYLGLTGSVSEDEGNTWFRPIVDANGLAYPYTLHNGNFFATDYDQKLYRSEGDIRHWQSIGVQFTPGISHKLLSEGANFYMLEYSGWNGGPAIIYKSPDNGLNWSPTGGTANSVTNLVAQDNFLFEWRGFYGLFRSQNGGATWQSVGAGLNELAQGSGDVRVYSDGTHLFVYDYYAIMVSDNDGLTFTKISKNLLGGVGFPVGADLLVAENNFVLVMTNDRIYLSQGLNDQWFDISANLPAAFLYGSNFIIRNGTIFVDLGNGDKPLWKRSIASVNLAQFDGKVWHDDNNNGQQDSGELPYAGAILQAGTGSFATSGTDGTYVLFADLNNDTLRVIKPAPWVVANPDRYFVNSSESGKDFGLYFPPDITDLRVDLTNETVFRPGFKENIYLNYANVGTRDADALIWFVADPSLEFQTAFPSPDGFNGDTLFWNLQNLGASTGGHIVITVKVLIGVPIGTAVTAYAGIHPNLADANPPDNQSELYEYVVGSYDPNDKRCNVPGITPEQIVAGDALIYTIRFQNTGTYSAEFVRIADSLDFTRLDVSSFQVLSSSHPCQTFLRGNGAVEFLFDPIDLPPSDFNEPASHGFVKYSIRPKPGLALGQQILNTAHIYFDFNPDIVTNTTVTSVSQTVGAHHLWQKTQNQALVVLPNPSSGNIQIIMAENGGGALRVFNASGLLVYEKSDCSNLEKLDLNALPSGHYLLDWQSESGQRYLSKLVIIK